MGSVPFAFSVHHFINSVGADAGFAAIIGLAILILLYFAQARETATLRDHAYEASQRIQQLEGRIAQFNRQAGSPTVAPAPPRAQPTSPNLLGDRQPLRAPVPAGVRSAALMPAAPAGVGAPSLAAATRLIPLPGISAGRPAALPAMAVAAAAAPVAARATAARALPGDAESAEVAAERVGAPAARVPVGVGAGLQEPDATGIAPPRPATAAGAAPPAPATAAGGAAAVASPGANGVTQDRIPPPAAAPSGPRRPDAPVPADAPPRIQIRPGANAARRPLIPPPGPERPRAPRIVLALIGLVAIGAVVALLLVLTSQGGNSPRTGTNLSSTTNLPVPRKTQKKGKAAAAFQPSSVTVAVLNGTSVSELAHRVGQKLAGAGYKEGALATASDQTHTSSVVAYMPGHRGDALHVAAALKLSSSAVQAIDSTTQAVACPPSAPCPATVVVTVGTDLSNI